MLFTWVPQFGKHILWQSAKAWFYFLAMGVIFWFLPLIVYRVAGAPPAAASHIFDYYTALIALSFAMSFIAQESFNAKLRKHRAETVDDVYFLAQLHGMSRKAGLWHDPELVVADGPLNAAATWGPFSPSHVIAMGGIRDVLSYRQRAAVFGHELSHIKHMDPLAFAIVNAGTHALSAQLFVVGISIVVDALFVSWLGAGELWYAVKLYAITSIVAGAYLLLRLAFSRAREYLADIGAMSLLDLDHRDELIGGMITVGLNMSGGKLMLVLQGTEVWFLRSHPSTGDRAAALGVSVIPFGPAIVLEESRLT